MLKKTLAIALIVVFVGFFLAYVSYVHQRNKYVEISADNKSVYISAELAGTQEEWQRGLMYRTYLPENSGMLFIFPDEQQRSFWMKNTLIPLDIIFASSNMSIVDIKENFQPCEADPCPSYVSKPAMYVLEVNGGFVERNQIKINDKIKIG